jgi:hypothetical protein
MKDKGKISLFKIVQQVPWGGSGNFPHHNILNHKQMLHVLKHQEAIKGCFVNGKSGQIEEKAVTEKI